MTKRDIAVLTCKILGIYFVVSGLRYLGLGAVSLVDALYYGIWDTGLLKFFPLTLFVAVGLILWWQSGRLATYMLSAMEVQAPEVKVIQMDIEPIAISAVGLIVLSTSDSQCHWVARSDTVRSQNRLAGFFNI